MLYFGLTLTNNEDERGEIMKTFIKKIILFTIALLIAGNCHYVSVFADETSEKEKPIDIENYESHKYYFDKIVNVNGPDGVKAFTATITGYFFKDINGTSTSYRDGRYTSISYSYRKNSNCGITSVTFSGYSNYLIMHVYFKVDGVSYSYPLNFTISEFTTLN